MNYYSHKESLTCRDCREGWSGGQHDARCDGQQPEWADRHTPLELSHDAAFLQHCGYPLQRPDRLHVLRGKNEGRCNEAEDYAADRLLGWLVDWLVGDLLIISLARALGCSEGIMRLTHLLAVRLVTG